jgi:hypothetical protein
LDKGGIAQRGKNTVGSPAHIVGNGQHKAGSQLSKRRASAGKGRGVWKEGFGDQQMVKRLGRVQRMLFSFRVRDVPGNPPEHFLDAFHGISVLSFA